MASDVPTPLHLVDAPRCAVAVGAVLFFCTGFDLYGYRVHSMPSPSVGILGVLACAVLVVTLTPHRPRALFRSPLLIWAAALLTVSTVWACWSSSPRAVELLVNRYKAAALLVAMMVIFDDDRARRAGALAMGAAVVIMSALNVAETFGVIGFLDVDQHRIVGRSAGFFFNPNESARAIVLALAASVVLLPSRLRVPLLIVAGVGTAATLSRGAWIGFGIVVLWLFWQRALRFSALGVSVAAALAAVVLWFGHSTERLFDSTGALNENTILRLHFGLYNESTTDRLHLAGKAWDLFASSPLVGHGLGASIDWNEALSSHNSYLNLAADHGLLGLLLFPMLCVALAVANRRVLPATLV